MHLVLRALMVLGLASLLHATSEFQAVSLKRKHSKTVRLVLDPSVQPHIAITSASDVANMSLSPWTYKESYSVSRLPKRISQAQCLTSGCLSLQGGGEDEALQAKPIYYQILVLHRVLRQKHSRKGSRKRYEFRLGTEVITVGCTCVRPSIIPQQ